MREKILQADSEKVFAVVFEKGDEFTAGMQRFVERYQLHAASFTAIGAFSSATIGYFDREIMDYRPIQIQEQVEVLSLLGNIALASEKGQPKIHAHVVLGKSDGSAHGGHLLEAHIWPTLEVIVTESPSYLQRIHDPELGIATIRL